MCICIEFKKDSQDSCFFLISAGHVLIRSVSVCVRNISVLVQVSVAVYFFMRTVLRLDLKMRGNLTFVSWLKAVHRLLWIFICGHFWDVCFEMGQLQQVTDSRDASQSILRI